jgi:hypothetical protein
MEGVLLVPLGSKMTLAGPEPDKEVPAALTEEAELELGTDPMLLAVPIG